MLIFLFVCILIAIVISISNQKSDAEIVRDPRRFFTVAQKRMILARQSGKCAICKKKLDRRYTQYDHKIEWADGGPTEVNNGQALCANCHSIKTYKHKTNKNI